MTTPTRPPAGVAPVATLAALLAGTALPALAQAVGGDGRIAPQHLGTITLTATGLPTEVLVNPASISVIDGEELRTAAPVSVAALLRDVPGVQIVEEGIERISIRGESSRRVAVLIDGQKLTDHTNYGQPILIDPASIERIEVVRGSSSVISGSQAIGGVVNIITRKAAAKPFELTLSGGSIGASNGWRGSAIASGTVDAGAGTLEYRLSFGKMEQDDRRTPEGLLDQSDSSDRTLSGYLAYATGNQRFGAEFLAYDLSANVPTGDPAFIIQLPKRDLRKANLFYEVTDVTPWLERLRVDLYRQTIDREFVNDITQHVAAPASDYPILNIVSASTDQQLTFGASLRAEMRFSDRSRTVVGLEYEDDRLTADKNTVTTVTVSAGPFPPPIVSTRLRYDEAKVRTLSLFGQHEIEFGRDLTLTLGGRWYDVTATHDVSRENGVDQDLYDSSDSRALFSAGLVWQPDQNTALRANISQGYIYPSLSQLFLSTTAGGEGTIIGNPELKPEQSTTFELGARRDAGGLLVDATLFYSKAKDYIASVVIVPGDRGSSISEYQNIDEARTWGMELHAEYDLGSFGLTPYLTAATLQREFTYGNGYSTTDSGAPQFAGRLGLRKAWQLGEVSGELDLFLRGESEAKLRNDSGEVTARAGGYSTLNLHASADFGANLTAVLEFNNITDRTYTPYGQAMGAGRSINVFLTKTF